MASLFTLFILSQVYTGAYAIANLYLFPLFKLRFGGSEFLITDPITIFPTFLITFELGRISLGKTKSSISSWKDIILVSILVSFFGFCFQLIIDLSASAIGFYYYQNPPILNIFGYPILFFMAFPFYGFVGFIFLSIEYYRKRTKKSSKDVT
jgi:hypothetical protein